MQYTQEERFWIWLASIEGVGPKRFYQLVSAFLSAEGVYESARSAGVEDILGPMLASKLSNAANQRYIENFFLDLEKNQVIAVALKNDYYPQRLKDILDAPPVLFVKGDLTALNTPGYGIVGSRRCTRYGLQAAHKLSYDLALNGYSIISGMARGIDSEAHKGAIEADNGVTVAVLGCGLDIIYPPENDKLYHQILEHGAIISEYVLGTKPKGQHFPARNRIISGMSQGVLLVEADEKSGAMITVDFALEQGRDVYCVPGSIFSEVSRGTNRLIKQGAQLVTEVCDIIGGQTSIGDIAMFNNARPPVQLDLNEQAIVNLLAQGELCFEELAEKTNFTTAELGTLLTMMELRGIIKQLPGKNFCLDGQGYY